MWIAYSHLKETHASVPSNHAYFLMEYWEGVYMQAFLECLLGTWKAESVLWMHDGVWTCPAIPSDVLHAAVLHAQFLSGFCNLRVRMKSLLTSFDDALLLAKSVVVSASAVRKFKCAYKLSFLGARNRKVLPPAFVAQLSRADCGHNNLMRYFLRKPVKP